MPKTEIDPVFSVKLEKMGFVYRPNLPGSPDFAHFDAKLAVCILSRTEVGNYPKFHNEFSQRFRELRSKKWRCLVVFNEDSLKKKLERLRGFMIEQEFAKVHMPADSKLTHKKLIKLLKRTDEELETEERKKRRNMWKIRGLEKRRKNIKGWLHKLLKPIILKRDEYKCRVCSSKKDLELARIITDHMAQPEKIGKRIIWRYPPAEVQFAEENMFTLCNDCHKRFDSFSGRLWRKKLKISGVDEAVRLLRSAKLKMWSNTS